MNANIDYKIQIQKIKIRIASGSISIEEARILATPILEEMNIKAVSIANEFGMKHKNITFAQLFR